MSIQSQIEALENLARIDAELVTLENELQAETGELGDKREQLHGLEAKLAVIEGRIQEMEKMRNDLLAEARQMSVQMERSRDKLNRCRNERESNAAQREVEELRKLYRDREIEVQKLSSLIDQARLDIEATAAERDALKTDLGETAGDAETRLSQLEAARAKLATERALAVKGVPPVLARRYEVVRQRRGSALAHTIDGTCSACHISLAPMMFQVLRRGDDFDQCPSCNRILYFRAAAEDSVAVDDSAEA